MGSSIEQALSGKILVLDGAMGTLIQQHQLTEDDFGGALYEGCNEYLTLTRPDVILGIHEAYLAAGADIIETNTFGATPLVLAEYDLGHRARELNRAAALLARQAADKYSTPGWPRFVAGSMGPTTKSLSVTGGATFDQLVDAYAAQAIGLLEGGVDVLLLETAQDLLNVKAGSFGIERAFAETGRRVPVMVSGTIEPMGTTLAGQTIEAFYLAVRHLKPLSVGLNCATGPEFMRDPVRTLADLADCGVSCYPNAGLPDENGHYHESPISFAAKVAEFAKQGWLNVVGGCCGTTPEHIAAVRQAVDGVPPRRPEAKTYHAVSGLEAVFLETDNRPILVGERTNVIGSRKFRKLIAAGDYDTASEVAQAQVKAGAQVIDICLADPDRDELDDVAKFLPYVVNKVKVPLMLDTTDAAVAELGLKHSQGKAILNSTNLEDGEPRLAKFADLARRYGAALVVGTIDEQGMAVTRERKLEVALRSVQLLTEKYGLPPEDIIIDPLTFPVGTGDEKYLGSARETVEGIRLIKQHLPYCPTILGVSNVSFGLPPAGREILNSVFLYECTKAGLDYAIVNSQKLERYANIPAEERSLCEKLLFATSDALVAEFTAAYRERKPVAVPKETLPLNERIARYVVDGSKDGLLPDLAEALQTAAPLAIINGPLMDGMNEVGRLFNNNELIVAEVLQSAEVMKAAVAFLEPHMEKTETATKAKILLATVKGDVHDIGKNLVEIILANNGFDVVNLGIKVTPEQLIQAVRETQPDMIGLSGLLVKSAQQMVTTAEDLRLAGIHLPLLVGGAALTKKFTFTRIQPAYDSVGAYAKDAMDGLDLANRLCSRELRPALLAELEAARVEMESRSAAVPEVSVQTVPVTKPPSVSREVPVQTPPDCEKHVLRHYPLRLIRPYVNLQMLLGKHLGLRGNVEKLLEQGDEKATALLRMVDELTDTVEQQGRLHAHAAYRFFPVQADGDTVLVYDPANPGTVLERFHFPRQLRPPYLCLADFVRPVESNEMDYIALFTVTAGRGIRALAEDWKAAGEYVKSHAIQAIAIEYAEGFAELLHHMLRDAWGIPDAPGMTMRERWTARYQGIRVSFGYPACPNIEDQAKLFRLLQPQDIGVELTDGFMMEPEASVSAVVFAHPEAKYFNVE